MLNFMLYKLNECIIEIMKIFWIIFGVSGDLAKNKLLPAFNKISSKFDIRLIGVSRKLVDNNIEQITVESYNNLDILNENLNRLTKGENDYRLFFHLALPPDVFPEVINAVNLQISENLKSNLKLVIEKPFYTNDASRELVNANREAVLLLDHYGGKNIELPKIDALKSVKITLNESQGLESRGGAYYDQYGVIWDMFHSHGLYLFDKVSRNYGDSVLGDILMLIEQNDYILELEQYEQYRSDVDIVDTNTATGMRIKFLIKSKNLTLEFESRKKYRDEKFLLINDLSVPILEPEIGSYGKIIQEASNGNYTNFVGNKLAEIEYNITKLLTKKNNNLKLFE